MEAGKVAAEELIKLLKSRGISETERFVTGLKEQKETHQLKN